MIALGEGAWRFELPPGRDPVAVLRRLRALPGVVDVVVTDRHALVCFDPASPPASVAAALVQPDTDTTEAPRTITLAVRYDGPDLAAVAARCGLAPHAVVALHSAGVYRVETMGFLPGFGYLGPLDARLVVPRRDTPRPRVPAGAVAIAGARTAVYPFASPGGWHLLGSLVGGTLFDPVAGPTLQPGDSVRFRVVP